MNGSLQNVAGFFGVSVSTVKRWNAQKPPRIAYWKDGGVLRYSEQAVAEYAAAHTMASRRMQPGEAVEVTRREWREFLQSKVHSLQSTVHGGRRTADLVARLERLEAAVFGGLSIANSQSPIANGQKEAV